MLPSINPHTDNKRDLAIQCLANHLYSPNGLMKEQYELMATNISSARKRRLLTCYFNDVLVGSILGIRNHIMVFVKPNYRRCGVASFLIGSYAKKYCIQKTSLEAVQGIKGSADMYFANGVKQANSKDFMDAFGYDRIPPKKAIFKNVK